MLRLARFLPSLTVAALLSCPVLGGGWLLAAPDAAAAPPANPAAAPVTPAAQPAAAPADPVGGVVPGVIPAKTPVQAAAEDFFHYASIGRFDLAKDQGEKILGMGVDPKEVLAAFEQVVTERNRLVAGQFRVTLDERMLSWQRNAEVKDTAVKLIGVFNQARKASQSDPAFITQQIERLDKGQRAYSLAVEQLRGSGEVAVPVMLRYLNDPAKKDLHVPIRIALRDMGLRALNPLTAATEMKDANLLPLVAAALGDLGYDNAIPYLVRLAKDPATPKAAKDSATGSLARLGVIDLNAVNAAQLFYDLAEKFYYEKASVAAGRGASEAYLWYWTDRGLIPLTVPAATFNEDMAMRTAEHALKQDPNRGDAVSLWLAAGYKREVETPEGQQDKFWAEGHPPTHYYAVASGAQHLGPALARALRDGSSAVALKAIKSMQEIAGATNLFTGEGDNPVMDALRYPDKHVRFEAAFTVAEGLPQRPFVHQDRVVPIIAEALAQSGKPGVLVVAPTDKFNQIKEQLKAYAVAGAATADAAVNAANQLTSVDVILMYEGDPQLDQMLTNAREVGRLGSAARLIVVKASKVASPYAQRAASDQLVTLTDAADEAGLNAAVEEARKRAGGLPMDEKMATDYALRAANLLGKLAMSRGQVLDLTAAQPALLASLEDPRLELVRAVGHALGLINTREAQAALAAKALDEKTADDMKVSILNDLSTHAKFFGNQIDTGLVDQLQKLAESAPTQEVKSAAAEALGSLNLRSEQVKTLILNQAK